MRRLWANDTAVSQKTYLEQDDVVLSWIGAIVAVDCYALTIGRRPDQFSGYHT
jgi:hypothetical protein